MLRSTRILTALAATMLTLAPLTAHAGAAYEAVWYPDGTIRWFNKSVTNAGGTSGDASIVSAMGFLEDHTPLDIAETTEAAANLTFHKNIALGSGSGMTYAYWDQSRSDGNKSIDFSPEGSISTGGVLHEIGHALGFPHEFQRDDRDSFVDVCFNVDPFNYGKMGSAYWPDPGNDLSPFDFASIMGARGGGYTDCVTSVSGAVEQSRKYRGGGISSPLSIHDINSIYRIYAGKLGSNGAEDRFGHAVAAGDYDDDGIDDLAVASSDPTGSDHYLSIFFFRGVETAPSDSGAGTRYIPWFREAIDTTSSTNARLTLASGDFNGDGITDLAVGEPWFNGDKGRVKILFVNSGPDDAANTSPSRAPWGRKGVQSTFTILPADVGLPYAGAGQLGASLAAGRLTASATGTYPRRDLIIGAPTATTPFKLGSGGGAVVLVQGSSTATVASWALTDHEVVYNPGSSSSGEFGSAVSAVPGLCGSFTSIASSNDDGFVVGAPAAGSNVGAAYVYGCARDSWRSLTAPTLLTTVNGAGAAGRYGAAVAGFRRRTSAASATYKYYAAIGAPDYSGAGANPRSGIVYVDEYSLTGAKTFIDSFRPTTRSNNDEFGHSIAVQQTATSSTIAEGSKEVYLAIGMPGTEVSGVVAGKVYVWRPWNSDGTLSGVASVISPTTTSTTSATRYGEALATLRNLDTRGGFVTGAPESRESDGVEAGSAEVLLNDASSSFDWSNARVRLSEESEGDHRPTN